MKLRYKPYYAQDPDDAGGNNGGPDGQNEPNEPEPKADDKDQLIPKKRLDQVIGQREDALQRVADLQKKVDALTKQHDTEKAEKLKAEGKTGELLTETEKKLDAALAEVEILKGKATQADEFVAEQRKNLLDQLSPEDQQIADKLELKELAAFVGRHGKNSVENMDGSNPKRDGKNQKFGGYSSRLEWAKNDPQGYEKHIRENVKTPAYVGNIRLPGDNETRL